MDLHKVQLTEKATLHNMMQFYIYEFSKYLTHIKLNESGRYEPFDLDDYWSKPNYHSFFIKIENELAGFVLVHSETDSAPNTIAEFFVMRKFEGKGIGKKAAKKIFDMFPGNWKVTQIEKNYSAQAFWRSVIAEYTNGNYKERYDERRRSVQEFDSRIISRFVENA